MLDLTECREAISRFIICEYVMSVPPQPDDDDVLLHRALDELERLRKQPNLTSEEAAALLQGISLLSNDCYIVYNPVYELAIAKLHAYIQSPDISDAEEETLP